MKTKIVFVVFFLSIGNPYNYAQTDYSNPKNVTQDFLDLCLAGKRFEACKLYGTEGSSDQIEILIKQLVMKDIPLVDKTCKYSVDSCQYDEKRITARCHFVKLCADVKKDIEGYLTLKKIDDRWLVEYVWKRDRYL